MAVRARRLGHASTLRARPWIGCDLEHRTHGFWRREYPPAKITHVAPSAESRHGDARTKPNYGGRRWWFICPIVRRDGGPPRRVAKLYLPSGSKYFGSREAYGLTYTSCQESEKSRGLFRRLAAEMGADEKAMIRLLKGKAA